jgi:hypothetical protein
MNDSFNRVLPLVRCVEDSLKVVSSDIYSGSLLALVLSTLASDELRTLSPLKHPFGLLSVSWSGFDEVG